MAFLSIVEAAPPVAQGIVMRYDARIMTPLDAVPNDTGKDTEREYIKLLRATPPWRKAAMVDSLIRTCQELAVAGIRMRHPNATEKEIQMRVASLWLDRNLMIRIFNWDPAREGY